MNPLQAKQLLLDLEAKTSRNPSHSLESQLHLFVPAFWNENRLVSRETWRGKVSLILNSDSRQEQVVKVKKVFAEALTAIRQNQELASEISLSVRLGLSHLLHREHFFKSEPTISLFDDLPRSELDQIQFNQQARIQQENQQDKRRIQQFSLLHSAYPVGDPVDFETFSTLFNSLNPLLDFGQLDYAIKFLQRYHYIHPEFTQRVQLLENALVERQLLQVFFLPNGKPLPTIERQEKIQEQAQELVSTIQGLEAQQKWMFCGSYGKYAVPDLNTLFQVVNALPPEVAKELKSLLPASFNSLESDTLPDPKQYVETQFQHILDELQQKIPGYEKVFNSPYTRLLLGDPSRALPNKLASHQPKFITENIESWLKQGLLGNIMEFTPDGGVREFILWLLDNQAFIQDATKRHTFVKEQEEKLLEKGLSPIDKGISQLFEVLHKNIPHLIFEMIGVDSLLSPGSFWIEFERQADGRYTLLIYASGNALRFHSKDISGKVQWPMRLKDVEAHKLNETFFQRLLSHTIDPLCDAQTISRSDDLYEGLLSYLEATPNIQLNDYQFVSNSLSTIDMASTFLMDPRINARLALFEMRCQAFIKFCQPYMSSVEQTIVLDTPELQEAVEKAIQVLIDEAEALKVDPAITQNTSVFQKVQDTYSRLEITQVEIRLALAKAKALDTPNESPIDNPNRLGLPQAVILELRNILKANNISIDQLKSARDLLIWSLGEDIGDVIDALIDSLGVLPNTPLQPTATPAQPARARGWLGTILLSVYFRTTMQVLNIVVNRSYAYGLFTLARPLIKKTLQRVIPLTLQIWFAQAMSAIQRKLAEMTINIILACLFSKEEAQKLKDCALDWREQTQSWAKSVLSTQAINWKFDPSVLSFSDQAVLQIDETENGIKLNTLTNNLQTTHASLLTARNLLSFPASIAGPFPAAHQCITAENVRTELESWIQKIENLKNIPFTDQYFYLIAQLNRLEIPQHGQKGIWDKVDVVEIEQCLDLLSNLSGHLDRAYNASRMEDPNYKEIICSRSAIEYGDLIVTLYGVLAMMDKLAKRCPKAHLENYQINAYGILTWLDGDDSQLDTPQMTERLVLICNYLLPDIDLNHRPSVKEIQERTKKALFNYDGTSCFPLNKWIVPLSQSPFHLSMPLDNPEILYFKEKLQDPDIQQKIHQISRADDLSEDMKLSILFHESQNFNSNAFFSSAYLLLRLQVLLVNTTIKEGIYKNSLESQSKLCNRIQEAKSQPSSDYNLMPLMKNETNRLWTKTFHEAITQFQSFAKKSITLAVLDLHYDFRVAFNPDSWDLEVFKINSRYLADNSYAPFRHAKRLSQSTVMSKIIEEYDQQKYMIECESSEYIVQTLAFIKEYKAYIHVIPLYIEDYLFNPGKLRRQLQESPQVAGAIGDCLTELLSYNLPDKDKNQSIQLHYAKLIEVSLRLQKYCRYYCPQYMDHFPNFRAVIHQVSYLVRKPFVKMVYQILDSLAFGDPSASFSAEDRGEAILAISKILFDEKHLLIVKNKQFTHFYQELQKAFKWHFWKWMPTIEDYLKDSHHHQRIFAVILEQADIPYPEKQLSWTYVRPGVYCYDDSDNNKEILINFNTQRVLETNTDSSASLKMIQQIAQSFTDQFQAIYLADGGTYQTPDGEFSATVGLSSLVFRRRCETRTFCHLSHQNALAISQLMGYTLGPNDSLWIEETSHSQKEVRLYRYQELISTLNIIKDNEASSYRVKDFEEFVNLDRSYAISGSVLSKTLAPLERFCPLNHLNCYGNTADSYLQTIEITPYKLSFHIEDIDQKPQAVSTLFSGYFIAPQQLDPTLQSFVSYLLLTNRAGQKKILIPQGQWMTSVAWRAALQLGSLANLANSWFHMLNEQPTGNYHVYDINEQGQLTSENAEALIYLILLYLIQGNNEKALETCVSLEMMCKLRPVPDTLEKFILPMMVIPDKLVRGIASIRRRLLAAFEENRCVHLQVPLKSKKTEEAEKIETGKKADSSKIDLVENALFVAMLIADLKLEQKETDHRRKLRDDQEWFLFKTLCRQLEKMATYTQGLLKDSGKETDKKRNSGKNQQGMLSKTLFHQLGNLGNYTQDLLKDSGLGMGLNLLPSLSDLSTRYQQLKNQFGIKDSLIASSAQAMIQIYNTPSGIPHFAPRYSLVNLNDNSMKDALMSVLHSSSQFLFRNHLDDLNPSQLLSQMHGELSSNISFNNVKAEQFIRHYVSYYKIALEGTAKEKEALQSFLLLMRGGWDKQSQLLISYLKDAMDFPCLFPKTETFLEKLKKIEDSSNNDDEVKEALKKKEKKFTKFLQNLHKCAFSCQLMRKGVTIAGHTIGQILTNKFIRSKADKFSWDDSSFNPQPLLNFSTRAIQQSLSLGAKVYHWLSASHQDKNSLHDVKQGALPAISYAQLDEEEQQMDRLFEELYAIAFETLDPTQQPPEIKVEAFAIDESDPLKADRRERVNQSRDAYYSRADRLTALIKLKNLENIWDLYLNAQACRDALRKRLETDRQTLMHSLNAQSLIQNTQSSDPLKFEDLKNCFLNGDFQPIGKLKGLSPSLFPQIELSFVRLVARETRIQQLERAIRQIESLIHLNPQTQANEYGEKLELLAEELRTRRAFNFKDLPNQLIRLLLVFEWMSDKSIWKKQVETIKKQLVDNSDNTVSELMLSLERTGLIGPIEEGLTQNTGNTVSELMPSLGKTSLIAPIEDKYLADGKSLVFNIWPSSLIEPNTKQISQYGQQIFSQLANALHFDRNLPLTPDYLESLLVVFKRAMTHKETINMTKEGILSYPAILIDRLYQIAYQNDKMSKQQEEVVSLLRDIVVMIKTKSKLLGDEGHELLDSTNELNYPIGPPCTIKSSFYQVTEACLRLIFNNQEALSIIRQLAQDRADSLAIQSFKDFYQQTLIPQVAQEMSRYSRFKLQTSEERNEFADFVSGKAQTIPDWIKQSPYYSQISMIKGVLKVLLPLALSETVSVDYGRAIENDPTKEYACPYAGNTTPLEDSTIKAPYEALVKTYIMFIVNGLSYKQIVSLVMLLQKKAQLEMKTRNILANQTVAYSLFNRLFPNQDLLTFKWKGISQEDRMNPEASLLYIRFFVIPKLNYWKRSIRNTSFDFEALFQSKLGAKEKNKRLLHTGTPYNEGTYPSNLEMLWDPGTIGEALHIITQKSSDHGIHLLQAERPIEMLNEILHTFFLSESRFSALIDGGAQLTGLDNDSVARQIAEFVKDHRPDIKAINYFKHDENTGKTYPVSLLVDTMTHIPYDNCQIPLKARLTYFDQLHGFGANIPQPSDGKGLNLINKKHALYRFVQENFRMRGIKTFKKLIGFGKILEISDLERANLDNTQTIEFAMTKKVAQTITGHETLPTLRQLQQFTIDNEAELAEQNFPAYCLQIETVIKQAVMDKLLSAPVSQMVEIVREFEDILVPKLEDDPKKLFGLIESWASKEAVIQSVKMRALAMIKSSSLFRQEEKDLIIPAALDRIRVPFMPDQLRVYTDGQNIYTHVLEDLNKEVCQSQHNNQEQEQNLNQDLQNRLSVQSQSPAVSERPLFEEIEWPDNINPLSLDWLKFHRLDKDDKSTLSWFTRILGQSETHEPVLPVFQVQHILEKARLPALSKISCAFDSRLWFSVNFLPLIVKGIFQSPAEVGSSNQRPLYEVLIHLEENNGSWRPVSVGALSLHDAATWRKKLNAVKNESSEGPLKVILYHTSLRTVVAGHDLDIESLKTDPDFLLLEAQLKFLNGNVNYHQNQLNVLSEWMAKNKVEAIKKAFQAIHAQRSQIPISGTDIDHIFTTLEGVPVDEMV